MTDHPTPSISFGESIDLIVCTMHPWLHRVNGDGYIADVTEIGGEPRTVRLIDADSTTGLAVADWTEDGGDSVTRIIPWHTLAHVHLH